MIDIPDSCSHQIRGRDNLTHNTQEIASHEDAFPMSVATTLYWQHRPTRLQIARDEGKEFQPLPGFVRNAIKRGQKSLQESRECKPNVHPSWLKKRTLYRLERVPQKSNRRLRTNIDTFLQPNNLDLHGASKTLPGVFHFLDKTRKKPNGFQKGSGSIQCTHVEACSNHRPPQPWLKTKTRVHEYLNSPSTVSNHPFITGHERSIPKRVQQQQQQLSPPGRG